MRVFTGQITGMDSRMITVVVEGFGIGRQRRAERRLTVPFPKLQSLMQTIALNGGRIKSISSEGDPVEFAADVTIPAPSPESGAAPSPSAKKPVKSSHHADVPVNLYKPK
ncbi:MAG: ferredoxin-NADP reductase, partial [Cyanobacteriota bacterium]|nr:ferredoxin-NADP reductase [Cyanobacteriota bacterium]